MRNLLVKYGGFGLKRANQAVTGYSKRGVSLLIVPSQVGRNWAKIPLTEVVLVRYGLYFDGLVRASLMINKEGDEVIDHALARRLMKYAPTPEQIRAVPSLQ